MKGKALIALLVVGVASSAIALSGFVKVFAATYNVAKTSTLGKAKCAVCHVGQTAKLNPYGQDIKQALAGSKVLTAEVLKRVETKDSDKDGATNIAEIRADKLPGDAKSVPTTER